MRSDRQRARSLGRRDRGLLFVADGERRSVERRGRLHLQRVAVGDARRHPRVRVLRQLQRVVEQRLRHEERVGRHGLGADRRRLRLPVRRVRRRATSTSSSASRTGWGISYAYQMCNTHPSSMSTATKPVHGDLMIFAPGSCGADATAGHVAVVDVVNATTVKVVQENVAGSYTYNQSCASCWLHAANNNGTNDPCATAPSNGLYCGQSTQFGGGTKDVLYDCQNGDDLDEDDVRNGCIVEPPNTNDQCAPAPADAGSDASSDASGPTPRRRRATRARRKTLHRRRTTRARAVVARAAARRRAVRARALRRSRSSRS